MSQPQTASHITPTTSMRPAVAPIAVPVERRMEQRFRMKEGTVVARCPAFEPKGGYVQVRRRSWLGILPAGRTQPEELNDLSRGGLSFASELRFEVGQRIRLWLHVAAWSEPMELSGEVRWVRPIYPGVHMVGVRFSPFGEAADCNPPEALAALARLEARCVRGVEERAEA